MRDHFFYYPLISINVHTKYSINSKPETIKLLEENIVYKLSDINVVIYIWICSLKQDKQSKNKQMNFIKLKKLLYSKGNHQQNKKTTYDMEEHICKWFI